MLFVLIAHYKNIIRLIKGEENRYKYYNDTVKREDLKMLCLNEEVRSL